MKQLPLLIIFLFSCSTCFAQQNDTTAAVLKEYHDKVIAVFTKCNSHDKELTTAITGKNPKNIESARVALLNCAVEGMKQLSAMDDYDWDPSLKFSCRDVLQFYKQVAESDIPHLRDFFIVEENFLRLQEEFKKRPLRKRSQAEINAYNAEANKYNQAVTRYIQFTNFIDNSRKQTLYNWNASRKIFMDIHAPKS